MKLSRALPVLVGLALVAIVFQSLNANFLSPRNLTNLGLQIAAMATVSSGIVLVLLLGEIDLSAGAVSGLCAAVMGVAVEHFGVPGPIGLGVAIAAGLAIGAGQGAWISALKVPSFIVTLAGLLAWQGAQLAVLGSTGSLNLTDPFIVGLSGMFLPAWVGAVIVVAAAAFSRRWVLLAALGGVAVFWADRGVPLSLLIVVALMAGLDFVVRRTRFGRHVLAVGGGVEAARRAGIRVERVKVMVFALASALAAFGGVLAGSRLLAVSSSSGGGDLLLNAIAAAVIGGTSLFGGRGSIWSALGGALAIGAISNGMDLLALASPVKYVVTGAVLLIAVTLDASTRAQRRVGS